MKKIIALFCAVIMCAGFASAQDNGEIEKTTLMKEGMKAPAFTVKMTDGTTISSADFAGKVVLVNFWATWCPPCRKEFTRFQKDIVDRFAGKNFVLLPLSIDDNEAIVKEFMRKNGYKFPVAWDGNKSIYKLFAEKFVPRNFVIGTDGRIAFESVGYTAEEFEVMVKRIETLLKK